MEDKKQDWWCFIVHTDYDEKEKLKEELKLKYGCVIVKKEQ